jgi:hypothetical protein
MDLLFDWRMCWHPRVCLVHVCTTSCGCKCHDSCEVLLLYEQWRATMCLEPDACCHAHFWPAGTGLINTDGFA